jgi:hypothetical protein
MRRLFFLSNTLLTLAFLLLLAGCGSQPQRAIITTGVIENAMNQVAHDVRVVHYPKGTFAEFSAILPSTTAEIGIRPTRLQSEEAEIFWSVNGVEYQVRLELPKYEGKDDVEKVLVYTLYPEGRATVKLAD